MKETTKPEQKVEEILIKPSEQTKSYDNIKNSPHKK